ncbi:MAG: hypothetical protein Q4C09_06275, partial [Atopobiaceae bacterium]|nr:hypothetical protein [Atopobiaceae bacterium]
MKVRGNYVRQSLPAWVSCACVTAALAASTAFVPATYALAQEPVEEQMTDDSVDTTGLLPTEVATSDETTTDALPAENETSASSAIDASATIAEVGTQETSSDDTIDDGTSEDDATTEQEVVTASEAVQEPTPQELQQEPQPAQESQELLEQQALNAAADRQGHWVVDARSGSLERYWVWNDDGSVASNTLVGPQNGAGYYAWALSDGRILRGKWDSGWGRVYVANNDGRLIGSDLSGNQSGWVVSKAYDHGSMQRYWVDVETRAAVSGFFTVEGYGDLFGTGGQGYVRRGDFTFDGRKWSADNDGKLRSGWYVTSGFGQGVQRYWMGDTAHGSPHAAAVSRLVDPTKENSGYYAWALSDGRILRGKWDSGWGRVYVANNDGRLIGNDLSGNESGWVVTKAYDNGSMQRYWVDAQSRAAVSGFFTVDGYGDLFGIGEQGYVLRGTQPFGSSIILADNDGKLPSSNGWLVSSKYGHGVQRYWIEYIYKTYRGVKPGYSVEGWTHYTNSSGFVVRNAEVAVGGSLPVWADNDGRLGKATPKGYLKITSLVFTPTQAISLHEGIDFYEKDGGYYLERNFLKNGDRLVVNTNKGTKAFKVVVEFGDATLVNETDPYDTLKVWAFGNNDDDGVDF